MIKIILFLFTVFLSNAVDFRYKPFWYTQSDGSVITVNPTTHYFDDNIFVSGFAQVDLGSINFSEYYTLHNGGEQVYITNNAGVNGSGEKEWYWFPTSSLGDHSITTQRTIDNKAKIRKYGAFYKDTYSVTCAATGTAASALILPPTTPHMVLGIEATAAETYTGNLRFCIWYGTDNTGTLIFDQTISGSWSPDDLVSLWYSRPLDVEGNAYYYGQVMKDDGSLFLVRPTNEFPTLPCVFAYKRGRSEHVVADLDYLSVRTVDSASAAAGLTMVYNMERLAVDTSSGSFSLVVSDDVKSFGFFDSENTFAPNSVSVILPGTTVDHIFNANVVRGIYTLYDKTGNYDWNALNEKTGQTVSIASIHIATQDFQPLQREIVFDPIRVKKGTTPPAEETISVGASGNVKAYVLSFNPSASDGSEEEVWFEMHMPEDLDNNYTAQFHVMYIPKSTWASGDYVWNLEYLIKTEATDFYAGTPTVITATSSPKDATTFLEVEFEDRLKVNAEQIIYGRFYLDDTSTATVDGHLFFVEVEYTPVLR